MSCLVATAPKVQFNFGAIAFIANFIELEITTSSGDPKVTTSRHNSRVRWGDAGSAGVLIDMPETQFIFTNNGVVIGS